ncbi:MAG: hypothetical protein NTW31_12995, partial [Bacteroidetes bacterium]|nr:hypothetical protein [Bacteroidota bacterium]
MRNRILLWFTAAIVLAAAGIWFALKPTQKTNNQTIAKVKPEKEKLPPSLMLPMMAERQLNMLRDPQTGKIPS